MCKMRKTVALVISSFNCGGNATKQICSTCLCGPAAYI